MAQPTGSAAYNLRGEFDPRDITLRQYMTLYVTGAQMDGGRVLDNWENKIEKNPVYKDYLDKPIITVFDPKLKIDGKTIQQAAEEAEATLPRGGSPNLLQSRMRTLEEGVFVKLREIDAEEGTRLAQDYRPVTDTVKKLSTRGGVKTAIFQYRTSGIGELIANLEKHVEKFPDDKPIANAILLNLEMGSRPSLPTELTSDHYVFDQSSEATRIMGDSGADGVLIPAGTTGVKRAAKGDAPNLQPYNAPLSQRAVTILQDQSDYNRTNFGDNRRLSSFFQIEADDGSLRPLDLDKDINRVLALVTPKGIIQKIGDKGGITPTNKVLTSSDLRKLFINAAEAAGIPKEAVAALISRDTAKNTGSHGLYIGNAGEYSRVAVQQLNEISRRMWGQYSIESTSEGKKLAQDSKGRVLLSTNTLLFGDNTPERNKVRTFEEFGGGVPQDLGIQAGGFSVKQQEVNEDVETTRQVDNKMAGGAEYVPYTDDMIAELKANGLWNEDMQARQDAAVKSVEDVKPTGAGKKILKAIPYVGTGAALAAMPDVAESATLGLEKVGLPKSIAEPVGAAAAVADFGIGAILPFAPSDVVDIGGAIVDDVKKSRERSREIGPRGRNLRSQQLRERQADEGFISKL
tara:strand:+ start:82 stop:1971 length:1890 start_codon:yes stop_codon:yes gene_type:complete